MGVLKPIRKNEFQTLTIKVSQGLHDRLRTIQKNANDLGLEFDSNEILVSALEKAVGQAEKEIGKLGKKDGNAAKAKTEETKADDESEIVLGVGNGAETASTKVL